MGVESVSPKIAALKMAVEKEFGKIPRVHNDFVELAEAIKSKLRQHISETTLERVWNYSKRGYETVSLHTLNLLCLYSGKTDWQKHCESLGESGIIDSDMFEGDSIKSEDLQPGTTLKIGWLPDRLCIIEYLGHNRFMALDCENSTMQPGDTFSCLEFRLNHPVMMAEYVQSGCNDKKPKLYIAGKLHGLKTLKIL